MEVTNAFREAVKTEDVWKVRIMMSDSLLRDPEFKLFEKMKDIALESLEKDVLYDEHDGGSFLEESAWDDDYMHELLKHVVKNFSEERLEHLKKVINKLHPLSDEEREYIDAQKKAKQQKQAVGTGIGAAAGAVAGGILAGVLDAPVVAGVLAGAAIAGAATYIYTGKE